MTVVVEGIESRPKVYAAARTHRLVLDCSPAPKERPDSCGIGVATPPDRPDPATYSQLEQLDLGAGPSWDSPDIFTNTIAPWRLIEELRVRVRNRSATASAVNVSVHLFLAAFGIGTQRSHETTKTLTLAPSEEVQLFFPLGQATLGGDQRIAVHSIIEHPHDRETINNDGAQIVFAALTSEVGRTPVFSFPVRNSLAQPQQISLSVLANELGATVTPPTRTFAPFEQIEASLRLVVPAALPGAAATATREATVLARGGDGALIDGLTHILFIDS